jgi:uncharacterized protein DUF4157
MFTREQKQTRPDAAVVRRARSGSSPGRASSAAAQSRIPYDFAGISILPQPKGILQRKLAINAPGDAYEKEADHVAAQLMRMPSPQTIPIKASGPGAFGGVEAPPIVHEVLRSPGQPLDPETRAFMEPRLGHDFSSVRVHADAKAEESAQAVNARAYTVGQDIVFGSGEFAPGTQEGRSLLTHELVHVVQQPGASHLHRKPTAQDIEGQKKAVKQHQEQQKNVASLMDEGRKKSADAARGTLDPDNLFHNTVELIDGNKIRLTVFSPTHDTATRKPPQRAYFDATKHFPDIGGDYPADPDIKNDNKLMYTEPGVSGETASLSLRVPGFVSVFTQDFLIGKDEFRKVLVHEGQHFADLHGPAMQDVQIRDPEFGTKELGLSELALEKYKSEFRAYWIQPPIPPACSGGVCLGQATGERWADASEKAENKDPVEVTPAECTICPEPKPSRKGAKPTPAKVKTNMQNRRQEQIFHYLMREYKKDQFGCCYVYDSAFRTEVDNFRLPASVNPVNSIRLFNLTVELEKMNPGMSREQVLKADFAKAVEDLDPTDWLALYEQKQVDKHKKKSGGQLAPFWDLTRKAPVPLADAMKALADKKNPKPSEVHDALQKALAKLKKS